MWRTGLTSSGDDASSGDWREHLTRGLELLFEGAYFEAHEELELAWRAAPVDERAFCQGLVHVAVGCHHEARGNLRGCALQLAKARRRLADYTPHHLDVDVDALLLLIDVFEQQQT